MNRSTTAGDPRRPPTNAFSAARSARHAATWTLAVALTGLAATANAQSASEWLARSQAARFPGKDQQVRFTMSIERADGTMLERTGTAYRLNLDGGLANRLFVVETPPTLAGLSLLSQDVAGKPARQWLYIPAYRRARRVAIHGAGDGFIGSDFTYADLGRVRIEAGEHSVVGKGQVRNRPCVVIATKNRDPSLPYSEMRSMIDEQTRLPLKIKYYGDEGKLLKEATIDDFTVVGGFVTPRQISMINHVAGGRSVLRLQGIRYDVGLDADLFTVEHLEKRSPND